MMNKLSALAAVLLTLLTLAPAVRAFQCNECHSKNPAMVKMHKALQGRGCFDCHKVGEQLMGKARPKDRDVLLKRRGGDPLCVECHKG
jgi:hypothetical protein